MNGTLALIGSGEYLPLMEPVDRFLLSCIEGTPRVMCLPTAAGTEGDERIAYWSNLGVDHFTKLGAEVHAVRVINRATAMDKSNAARIREANFVYLSGGKPPYLYDTLRDTAVWDAILGVLESGGVVAGCSAGAMIWGERATPLPWSAGFGKVPAVIIPHYDEMSSMLAGTIKTLLVPGRMLLGIDGNTALVITSDHWTVAGSGGVTVWKDGTNTRYIDGQTVPL